MWWWMLAAAYWLGFTQIGRLLFLWAEEAREVKNERRRDRYAPMVDRSDIGEFWAAFFGSIFWPIAVFIWVTKKLMFPRGMRTKRAIRLQREKEAKERQARFDRMETAAKRLLELDQRQRLAITAGPGEGGINPLQIATDYAKAEAEFAEACRIVQENAGKPWSIGSLAKVRIRKPRAKTAA